MKSCVRIGSLVIALGLAGLFAGCASTTGKTSQRARDFEIVETSTKRTLTSKEMTQLQAMVADYLKKEGATGDGDYYVKVFLTPDKDGVPGEWVVVRYSQPTAYAATGFSLLSSYPDYGYSSYYPRYDFDFYPFWWLGFSSFALSYYDDPFNYYGYGSYYPRQPYANHRDYRWDRDHDRDRNHHPDGRHDQDRPRNDYRPSDALKPSFKPSLDTTTRWNGSNPPSQDMHSRGNDYSNHTDSRQRWRGRDNPSPPPLPSPGTPYTPTYRPPSQAVADNIVPGERHARMSNTRDRDTTDNRPSQNRPASSPQVYDGQQPSSSGNNLPIKPSHSSQRRESAREVRPTVYTPPEPRSEPAPATTPAPARSEPSDNSSTKSQESSRDGGRRWH